MDEAKLKKLRELYSEADGSEYLSERFKHVGKKLADTPRNTIKPYAGVPTFLDLPYNGDFSGLDVALIGVPMDLAMRSPSRGA